MSEEPYGQTAHFTFMSQFEASVIFTALNDYIKANAFYDTVSSPLSESMRHILKTARALVAEIEDMPCGCPTCKYDREHPEYIEEMLKS